MANRYKRNNTGLRIFCVVLALMLAVGLTLGGLELWGTGKMKPSEWFRGDPAAVGSEESIRYDTTLPANGGMILDEKVEDGEEDGAGVKSNGIALMSAAIPVAQYGAYGISPAAETARTVTATVSPDNEASNTKIKWELSWKNAASEWATGKEVTDYVTVQSNADDLMESKTCTVSCLQAFGERIQLKATAVDDETKFATCNVDYIGQVKSVSVAIGDVSVNLGGNTDITIAIRRDYGGKGGKVTVTPIYGDAYTIENEFTATASLTHETQQITPGGQTQTSEKWLSFYRASSTGGGRELKYNDDEDLIGDSIYFDRRIFTQYNFQAFYWSWERDEEGNNKLLPGDDRLFTTTDQIADLVSNFDASYNFGPFKNKVIWTMKVTLTSGSNRYSYESDLVWAAIDESVPDGDSQFNDAPDTVPAI